MAGNFRGVERYGSGDGWLEAGCPLGTGCGLDAGFPLPPSPCCSGLHARGWEPLVKHGIGDVALWGAGLLAGGEVRGGIAGGGGRATVGEVGILVCS